MHAGAGKECRRTIHNAREACRVRDCTLLHGAAHEYDAAHAGTSRSVVLPES